VPVPLQTFNLSTALVPADATAKLATPGDHLTFLGLMSFRGIRQCADTYLNTNKLIFDMDLCCGVQISAYEITCTLAILLFAPFASTALRKNTLCATSILFASAMVAFEFSAFERSSPVCMVLCYTFIGITVIPVYFIPLVDKCVVVSVGVVSMLVAHVDDTKMWGICIMQLMTCVMMWCGICEQGGSHDQVCAEDKTTESKESCTNIEPESENPIHDDAEAGLP
tara:strand:+ start:1796 stop:2470 length:675 start_codon:yes stop_codon:yes gene_type:complete